MFSSRASSNFANPRTSSAAGQAKSFAGQGGASSRMFKGPPPPPNPYGVSAHFDVSYYNMDPSHQPRSRNSWFNMFPDPKNHPQYPTKTPSRGLSSDMHHQKSSSFSIYPGMSRDMFIYEASNSEFSSPANSLTPIPFSPALSTDSLDSMESLESPIDAPPTQGRPPSRSSTPAPSTSTNSQAGLKGILRNTPQPQNSATSSGRYGQQPQSFVPFMPEREAELDHISRMNTEINSNTRFPPGGVHPNAAIPVERRDIPSQIYRDMPLSSSPESYEDSMYPHESGRDRRSRSSYAAVPPPPQLVEPSISQSTTSTLDPNHPLLQPPTSSNHGGPGQRQSLFDPLGSDSDGSGSGSTATMTMETGSGRRSSPPNPSRPRADSGAPRPSTIVNVSMNPMTPAENVSSSMSQQYHHQGSSPRRYSSAEPPVMPMPPPHVPPPPPPAAVSDSGAPSVAIPSIPTTRSRPQAVTLTTVESGSSSASERTIQDHDSSPRLEYRDVQRSSSVITSTRGPSAPTGSTPIRPRSGSISASSSTAIPPQFNTIPPITNRSSPPSSSQVPVEQRHSSSFSSPPRVTVTTTTATTANNNNNNNSVIPDPSLVHVETTYTTRSRTPGPKRSHSDGDNPIYSGATLRSATPFRTEFAPTTTNTMMPPPPPPEPRRRYSDEQPQPFSRAPVTVSTMVGPPPPPQPPLNVNGGAGPLGHSNSQVPISVATRSVRWNKNLICPSPVLPCNRRKGWFNRRGDQLWTNSGSFKAAPAGQDYPPDLDSYPEYGEGWMNEEGVKIDMMHRLVPKVPLRSALKQTRASNHA